VWGGGGGGGYSGGGGGSGPGGGYFNGFGGGGGGSYIDASAIAILTEISGISSPDGSHNGEIIITAVPEPTTLALVGLSGLCFLLYRRKAQSCRVDSHVVYED
ncbi:MAG: PEP-CTERM sorting domain-containing protein, partial [Verrucomicrobiia bacterium]